MIKFDLFMIYFSRKKMIGLDRCEKKVKDRTMDGSEANVTIETSKLVSYTLVQLIWCPYFE